MAGEIIMCISSFDNYFHEPLDILRNRYREGYSKPYWGDRLKTVNELLESIQGIVDTFKSRKWWDSAEMLAEEVLILFDLTLTLKRSGLLK